MAFKGQDAQKDYPIFNNVYEEVTERFHTELIPGTEVLTKTELSAEGLVESGKQGIILVPQPHNDIHDPLVCFNSPLIALFLTKYHRIGVAFGNWLRF